MWSSGVRRVSLTDDDLTTEIGAKTHISLSKSSFHVKTLSKKKSGPMFTLTVHSIFKYGGFQFLAHYPFPLLVLRVMPSPEILRIK